MAEDRKSTYVVRSMPVTTVEEQPIILKLDLTDEQKEMIRKSPERASLI